MVKVLAINSSPRRYGSTFKLLKVAARAAELEGADVELIHLYDYEIKPCQGCLSDVQTSCRFPCVIEDGGRELIVKVWKSDALIISTPVYWYGPSGHLKNLVDRLTALENMIFVNGRSWAEGKVAGFIAVGADSGNLMTISYLMSVLNSMGFIIPPCALAYYTGTGDPFEREESVMDAANVGYLVVKTAKLLSKVREWYDPEILRRISWEELREEVNEVARKLREEQLKVREKALKLKSGGEP